jgi:predicted lactoylglutathione lyase
MARESLTYKGARPMAQLIFVNLPVRELERSTAFYEALGARLDPRFSNPEASCMVVSETIHVMLLTHDFFGRFTPKAIPDPRLAAQVLLCLSADSRADVDAQVERARAAGGAVDPTPVQDYGLMYGRSYEDPDGHIWEVMWMDVDAFLAAQNGGADAAAAPAQPELVPA